MKKIRHVVFMGEVVKFDPLSRTRPILSEKVLGRFTALRTLEIRRPSSCVPESLKKELSKSLNVPWRWYGKG
jgi:hypothetical protein